MFGEMVARSTRLCCDGVVDVNEEALEHLVKNGP